MTYHLAIAGVAGRMGRSLISAALSSNDYKLIGGTERPGSGELDKDLGALVGAETLGVKASLSAMEAGQTADVWVDFTSPVSTLEALDALKTTQIRAAVIGTTGFNDAEEDALRKHGERIAVVKAGNFSLGVNLVAALVEQAAARLGDDWDIEVLETHHRHKVDAPSGTALMMGEAAAQGRGKDLKDLQTPPYDGVTGPREAGKIGFSVRRSGGVIGDHETTFASENEIISLRHTAMDRSIFAHGALKAGLWAVNQPPGYYNMRDVLGL